MQMHTMDSWMEIVLQMVQLQAPQATWQQCCRLPPATAHAQRLPNGLGVQPAAAQAVCGTVSRVKTRRSRARDLTWQQMVTQRWLQ
jgi:hypothetical protein